MTVVMVTATPVNYSFRMTQLFTGTALTSEDLCVPNATAKLRAKPQLLNLILLSG